MAVWNGIIGASSDDARQASGAVTLTDSPIILAAGTAWAGLRFAGCPIPKGAAIVSAVLTLEFAGGNSSPDGLVLKGEAHDNAPTFTTAASSISSRTMTTASATWPGTALGTGDHSSPDLAAVVGEITGRAGWAVGNALVLILDTASGTDFRFVGYDGSTTGCARLAVTYGGGAGPAMATYYARQRR